MLGLSAWLKQVIIVTLLAAFVDLLLPSNTMQKYVRMVMGLVVVLTILSPLMTVIHSGTNPADAILEAIMSTGQAPNPSAIAAQTQAITEAQNNETLLAWKSHLTTLLKDQIRRMYDVQAQSIAIDAKPMPDQPPTIRSVSLVLVDSEKNLASTMTDGGDVIKPVDRIVIGQDPSSGQAKTQSGRSQGRPSEAQAQIQAKVVQTIAQELAISPEIVHVQFAAATGQN